MAIPETKEGLQAAGYMFDNEARCRGCGEEIEWWITPNGKKLPMKVVEVRDFPKSIVEEMNPVTGYKRIPHFADCKNVKEFRKPSR